MSVWEMSFGDMSVEEVSGRGNVHRGTVQTSPKYYMQVVMKSNQTLYIVECVSWREENEEEGEIKST